MRPPFAYYGGKTGLARRIVDLMPPHRVYIEPFFGSGAVLFAKTPTDHEIINDLDGAVVAFFRCLRDRRDELAEACALTPYARAEYQVADLDEPGLEDLELARRFWARVNQSFAKTAGRGTGWSVTTARTQSTAASALSRLGRFGALADRLASVVIEQCDAAELVERLATPDTVVYADPPYVASSRANAGADYRVEGTDDGHRQLAQVLHDTPATVLLSGYHSPLYDDLYGDWWRIEWPVHVHSSNTVREGRGQRVEVLWSNRDLTRDLRLPLDEAVSL